jgi:hypothetical protein
VTAPVERERVRDVGQRGRDEIPPPRVAHASVQQEERARRSGLARGTVVEHVQRDAVDDEVDRAPRRHPRRDRARTLVGRAQ